ncbi:hypothetical protein EYF80_009356 [Liparis tanakae]|uniref:Uncharacterized protein n=1 Tax=Liparis tanakae TaxID=230148 RepID=A0A4Z2ISR9_9TELE|nr:hypothetical protein EYF80_009356 [Liparis tanakae]
MCTEELRRLLASSSSSSASVPCSPPDSQPVTKHNEGAANLVLTQHGERPSAISQVYEKMSELQTHVGLNVYLHISHHQGPREKFQLHPRH